MVSNGGTQASEPLPLILKTLQDLDYEVKQFLVSFKGKETEENWNSRELALQMFRRIIRGNSNRISGSEFVIKSCFEIVCATVSVFLI